MTHNGVRMVNQVTNKIISDLARGVRLSKEILDSQEVQSALRELHMSGAMREKLQVTLNTEDLPRARAVLSSFMNNEKLPEKERRESAKALMQLADFLDAQQARAGVSRDAKPISAMTGAELQAEVAALEAELAGRAKDVTPEASQAIDHPAFS